MICAVSHARRMGLVYRSKGRSVSRAHASATACALPVEFRVGLKSPLFFSLPSRLASVSPCLMSISSTCSFSAGCVYRGASCRRQWEDMFRRFLEKTGALPYHRWLPVMGIPVDCAYNLGWSRKVFVLDSLSCSKLCPMTGLSNPDLASNEPSPG